MLTRAQQERAQTLITDLSRSLQPSIDPGSTGVFWLDDFPIGTLPTAQIALLLTHPRLPGIFARRSPEQCPPASERDFTLAPGVTWTAAQVALLAAFDRTAQHEALYLPHPTATIDRALCRLLGTPTTVVRLSVIADGQILLATRSAHKRINPGLFDNVAAGMVKSEETATEALAREAWEEAGLRWEISEGPTTLTQRFHSYRPLTLGALSEETLLRRWSQRVEPTINDGEVARFDWVTVDDFLDLAATDRMVPEAALATLLSLTA